MHTKTDLLCLPIMSNAYEHGIYRELGEEITAELKHAHCQFVVNYDTLTYTFLNCPKSLVEKIQAMQQIKGEASILNEFIPS